LAWETVRPDRPPDGVDADRHLVGGLSVRRGGEETARMTTFVIVHGAWSGGHAWRWIRPLLRAAGHEVFTPSLTGLGERGHLASPEVDLDTHIRDVCGVLEFEDIHEVVLVGHSYGGAVVSGAADRLPVRVAHLVYLDADVPTDGEAVMDLLPPAERSAYEESARLRGGGWRIPPPVPDPLPAGLDPDVRWAMSRFLPQPLRTFTQPLALAHAKPAFPRTYVLHTEGREGQELPGFVQRISEDPGWRFVTFPAGHSAHVTAPGPLADLLLDMT
jgi:pimeloyl-ACP methyl ester carboxylesterase